MNGTERSSSLGRDYVSISYKLFLFLDGGRPHSAHMGPTVYQRENESYLAR